jgi:hypothetical protein
MKKTLPIFILALFVVGGGAFYGGMKYAENKTLSNKNFPTPVNFSPEERQQRFGQMNNRFGSGQNFVVGEIIARDDKSITVKLRDGGSKIIFFSGSAKITKSVAGSVDDLKIGETIMVSGTANQDGSVTAQTVQLRPNTPNS